MNGVSVELRSERGKTIARLTWQTESGPLIVDYAFVAPRQSGRPKVIMPARRLDDRTWVPIVYLPADMYREAVDAILAKLAGGES